MPQGCGPAVGMPPATNAVLATWKISRRDSVGFVRNRVLSFASKIASAIEPPAGSARVTPATTVAVSFFCAAPGMPPTCENAQLRAVALSQAHPWTRTSVGKVVTILPRLSEKLRVTSDRLPAATFRLSKRSTAPPSDRTRIPIQLMALGSVACTLTLSLTSTRLGTTSDTEGGIVSVAAVCSVTITELLVPRRPPESSAKPVRVIVPLAATTVTVS